MLALIGSAQSSWAQYPYCMSNCDGLPGLPPQTPAGRSYDNFVVRAYQGAYSRNPTCFERQAEWDNLSDAAFNGTLLEEARRFVATLFMTQASYNVPDLTTYQQTSAYQTINPSTAQDRASIERFVTDLYEAFLQRAPDQAGLCFWSNNVCQEGRKKGIRAFEESIEFGNLVNGLFAGLRPCNFNPDPEPCGIGRICPQ
ncbi:MAG TPA: DUF4214 domain-containing protein [Thermoanaerobaculia bacterium]|nr:DUF4214 domain-containing protein [Thermoanaerobaculia bacterium]